VVHSDTGYILPGRDKYLLALQKESRQGLRKVRVNISSMDWQRVDKHEHPDWEGFQQAHLNLPVKNIEFTPAKSSVLSDKLNLSELKFSVSNKSPYNYWHIDYIVALHGYSGQLLGVNRIRVEQFRSENTRQLELTWPGRLGNVDKIEVKPYVNIVNPEVYMRFEPDQQSER